MKQQPAPSQETFDKVRAYFGFAETRIPDALRVPLSWRGTAKSKFRRAAALFDVAEPLLGAGHGGAHARHHGHANEYFITRSPHCTLMFPVDHPTHAKTPRYDWVEIDECGPGVRFGYLKPECAELDGQADPQIRAELTNQQQTRYLEAKNRWHKIDDQPADKRSPEDAAFWESGRPIFDPDWNLNEHSGIVLPEVI